MEEYQVPPQPAMPTSNTGTAQAAPQTTAPGTSFILPPHSNKLTMSILCLLFCCLLGGIFAIVYSSKSNNLYNSAMASTDDLTRQNLYNQSVTANKTAKTWITISIITGIIYAIVIFILALTGALAELAYDLDLF